VAIVGAGSLASFLAPALSAAGYPVVEIIMRRQARAESMRRARRLASKVGAKAVTVERAVLGASLLWFCVPDREIAGAATALAVKVPHSSKKRYAFHSSGALLSGELAPMHKAGWSTASVHPLMTFVDGKKPDLREVPFAIEGDPAATRLARLIVQELGGEAFILSVRRKAAYHAWATMTSPLLVAYLVSFEGAARQAGLSPEASRRMSAPIIHQTLANYAKRGPAKSFSGPLIRGDVATVATHLELLKKNPATRNVYVSLARVALTHLPSANKRELRRLLKS